MFLLGEYYGFGNPESMLAPANLEITLQVSQHLIGKENNLIGSQRRSGLARSFTRW